MKTLADFKKAHDPTFQLEAAGATFHRPIDWKDRRRAIIVSAQNATPLHEDFWGVLNTVAIALDAEIIVIPLRYKNPTSLWSGSQKNAEFWAPEVRPYLWNVREEFNDSFTILGDIKTQPTNSNPLSGADALSHASSCVVGHTRAQTKAVPTPQNQMAKLLMTSGACTIPNYTDSRVGKLAEFHHSQSAVLVELASQKKFFIRRLNYSERTKRVIDLGVAYYNGRYEMAPRSLALVMGDTHVDYVDPDVIKGTFGFNGLIARTRPEHLIWHDLLDGHSCNPHHDGNPFADIAKYYAGRSCVNAETTRAIDFVYWKTQAAIEATGNPDLLSVIVPSNHIEFLTRWVYDKNWKTLPAENKIFYLETALAMAKGTRLTARGIEVPDPFTKLFREANVPNTRALDIGEPFSLADVALWMHGDNGPNGGPGGLKSLRRIGTKSIIGHSHSPGEDEGCTQVGTSTRLQLEYNIGAPSSWLNTHCDLNADAKRQLITFVEGEFCLS